MKTYSREWKCSAKRLHFARAWKNLCVCDENLLARMKMFRETLTFRETSRKILDIYVSAALIAGKLVMRRAKLLHLIKANL